MDDFIILLKNKDECKYVYDKIKIFLNERLNLEYNHKSRYYPNKLGINFCGYRIFETHKLLRSRCKKKIKKNINIWNKLYLEEKLNINKTIMCFNSHLAHIKHANSYNFLNNIYNKFVFRI